MQLSSDIVPSQWPTRSARKDRPGYLTARTHQTRELSTKHVEPARPRLGVRHAQIASQPAQMPESPV